MIGAILNFIGLNKAVVIAATALIALATGSAYLLKQSYAENGRLENQVEQWKAANNAWSESWQQREASYQAAMARLQKRDADYQRIEGELNDYQEKLRTILRDSPDDSCGVRPSIWMLIQDSAAGKATGSLPSN